MERRPVYPQRKGATTSTREKEREKRGKDKDSKQDGNKPSVADDASKTSGRTLLKEQARAAGDFFSVASKFALSLSLFLSLLLLFSLLFLFFFFLARGYGFFYSERTPTMDRMPIRRNQ